MTASGDDQVRANEWIGIVSERLQRQWPSIEAARLDDLAADLWTDEKLRAMAPGAAADEWLRPVAASGRIGADGPASTITAGGPASTITAGGPASTITAGGPAEPRAAGGASAARG